MCDFEGLWEKHVHIEEQPATMSKFKRLMAVPAYVITLPVFPNVAVVQTRAVTCVKTQSKFPDQGHTT